jgi:hypothetical protein
MDCRIREDIERTGRMEGWMTPEPDQSIPDITKPKTFAIYAVIMIIFGLLIGIGFHITFANIIVRVPCAADFVPLFPSNEEIPGLNVSTPNETNTGMIFTKYSFNASCYGKLSTIQGVQIILALVAISAAGAYAAHKLIPPATKFLLEAGWSKKEEDEDK